MNYLNINTFFFLVIHFSFYHFSNCEECKENLTYAMFCEQTIKPYEIKVYYFTAETNQVFIHLLRKQGESLLYGYFTDDINKNITQEDLVKFSYKGLLQKPQKFQKESYLYIFVQNEKNETNSQHVIIVYCSTNIDCSYSLYNNDFTNPINLDPNHVFSLNINGGYYQDFILNTSLINSNSTLTVYTVAYSGTHDTFLEETNTIITTTKFYSSKKTILILTNFSDFNKTNEITVIVNPTDFSVDCFYSIYYVIDEQKTQQKEMNPGIVEIYELYDEPFELYFPQKLFDKDGTLISLYLQSQNCQINIKDKNGISFYHENISKETNITITKTLSNEIEMENSFCTFFAYSINNKEKNLLILEKVPVTVTFYPDTLSTIYFQYVFIYKDETTNLFLLNIHIPEGSKFSLSVVYNNQIPTKSNNHIITSNVLLSLDDYTSYCYKEQICETKIEVKLLSSEESEFSIEVKSKKNVMTYIQKNIIKEEFSHFFYHDYKKSDKGKIIAQLTSNYLPIRGFSEEKTNASEYETIFTHRDTDSFLSYKALYQSAIFVSTEMNSTESLTFYLNLNTYDQYPINFTNFAYIDYTEPVKAPLNNKLTGYFREDEPPYSFLFTLPRNIRKFEIMIQGEYINYTINDIGDIKCNDKLNQTYIGQVQPMFLVFDIKSEIDTTKYNIQIQVDLNPIKYTLYETYYAIKVVPYDKLDLNPVYEIKGITQLECYTGENDNTIYAFFYNRGIIQSNKFLLFSYIKDDEINDVQIEVNYENEITIENNTGKWDNYFKENDNSNKSINYIELENKSKGYYFFKVKGIKKNQIINVFFSNLNEEKNNYIFTSEPTLYYLGPSQKKEENNYIANTVHSVSSEGYWTTILKKVKGTFDTEIRNSMISYYDNYLLLSYSLKNKTSFSRFNILNRPETTAFVIESFPKNISSNHIQKIEMTQNYLFYYRYRELPYRFYYSINSEIVTFLLTIKLTDANNHFEEIKNIDNFEIVSFLANSTLIERWINNENIDGLIKPKKEQFTFDYTFLLIYPTDKEEYRYYDKIYLEIRAKEGIEISEKVLNRTNFEIKPLYTLKSQINNYIKIFQDKYFHNYFDPKSQDKLIFLLDCSNNTSFVEVEFSLCSNAQYEVTFNTLNNNEIIQAESSTLYGRTIYNFKTDSNQEKVIMTISFTLSSKEDQINYIVKYSVSSSDNFKDFKISNNVTATYDANNRNLSISWGDVIETNYEVKGFPIQYFILKYDNIETISNKTSICSMFEFNDYRSTFYKSFSWKNENNTVFEFDVGVIGHFILEEKEYLISFSSIRVKGGISHYSYWIIICSIFLVLFLSFIFIYFWRKKKRAKQNLLLFDEDTNKNKEKESKTI